MPILAIIFLVFSGLSGNATAYAEQSPVAAALSASSTAAPSQGASFPADPSALIGMSLADVWTGLGVPASVYSVRGDAAWQDDVVFQYNGGVSLFWFQGRVWQVRINGACASPVKGLYLKDSETKMMALFGKPLLTVDKSYVFALNARGYPLRLRAVMKDGLVSDIYVYRADF
jgi:hypothetical protein